MVYGSSFNYNGYDSRDFGLCIASFDDSGLYDADTGLEIEVISDEGHSPFLTDYGIKYSGVLEFKIQVVHKNNSYFTRSQIREISQWLLGLNKPQWLEVFDKEIEDINFHCRCTNITKKKIGSQVAGLELAWTCTSPFSFSSEKTERYKINHTLDIPFKMEFYNDSDYEGYLCPIVTIATPALVSNTSSIFTIKNMSTNRVTQLTGLVNAETIVIDNFNQIITDDTSTYRPIQDMFNLKWVEMKSGINNLEISGTGTIEFKYRFIRKIGDF
ncbi:phage tail domain-containing protein [Konateibacter massiliensis]|uniref:phage tail domain-containing protein n=1 Tax=Konateibacter massiliensis TaxID=2002841 RepID=UPI000C156526|nr:phage tail domain-containing protein [Konateibacter massiliensis]